MAQRPAPLNMNKPSSAETQAKPNSARRHHSRTGQEALELLLASTDELHQPPPPLAVKPRFPKSIAHQKKIMALKKNKKSCSDFFLLSDFQLSLGWEDMRSRYRRAEGIGGDTGEFGRWNRRTWSQAARSLRALRLWRWLGVKSVW